MTDLLTVTQAAAALGVSTFHVTNNLIKKGLLPAQRDPSRNGRPYVIHRADVEALKRRYEAGEFRPGPRPGLEKGEKAAILDYYTRLKRDEPGRFRVEMERVRG